MDGESWDALIDPENPHGPTHAQFGMRMLLKYLGLLPSHVEPLPGLSLSPAQQARDWLTGEIMRPSATAAEWHLRIGGDAARVARGLEGVELLEASTPREEACQLALRIRAELSTPGRTVALVTPDRELALRIKAELSRWHIEADDSAGTSLNHTLEGSLFILILDLIASPREPVAWASLLHHPLVALGHDPEAARRIASHFDLVALRYGQWRGDIETLVSSLETLRFGIAEDPYAHPALVRLAAEDWNALSLYGAALADAMNPLLDLAKANEPAGLDSVIAPVIAAFERLTRPVDIWRGEFGEALGSALISMRHEAVFCPAAPFTRAAQTIVELIRNSFVRPPRQQGSRFAILGLLEARLIRADLMIMGSLNEAVWPSQPATGPWLNRPMRAALGLAAPEKDIGLAAHDFAQGFGAGRVILSWSKRVGDAPATPSRWLLRLKMLAAAADMGRDLPNRWQAWARALDHVEQGKPVSRPEPRPGVRLASISVSQVEKLHRDPYAVYARSLLNLVPLEPYAARPEASERGTLIHKALEDFTEAYKLALPADPAAELMRIGYERFAPRLDDPDIRGFWWPRFCRIAQWFAAEEARLRREAATVMTESRGSLTLMIAGEPFRLSGRADRIDIRQDRTIRILDYKTGTVPTRKQVVQGYAPQLTLEAEMIARGAFRGIPALPVSELIYMKLSGGDPAGEIKAMDVDDIAALAKRHLAELEQKLANLFTGVEAWIPRRAMQNTEDESEYDHLSRWREWRRA
jgi:ATP-dependent helicase/nuclease subunit B